MNKSIDNPAEIKVPNIGFENDGAPFTFFPQ